MENSLERQAFYLAAPMVGGLATSFALELLVYPAIYLLWRWHTEVRHAAAAVPEP